MTFTKKFTGKTTVVILNWNGERWLKPLLMALRLEDCKVVVVDNNSTDESRELATMKLNTNWGFAQGNNIGAATVDTENILFMNNDMLPFNGFLEKMEIRCTEEHPIVGAKLIFGETKDVIVNKENNWHFYTKAGLIQHAGVKILDCGLPCEIGINAEVNDPEFNVAREVDAVTGACMMIKTKLFNHLKGFDPNYLNGYEDIDLCLRSGFKSFYEPEAKVIHYTSSSEGRFDHETKNSNLFKQKWGKQL